jgi:hypothetical protein
MVSFRDRSSGGTDAGLSVMLFLHIYGRHKAEDFVRLSVASDRPVSTDDGIT